MKEIFCQKTCKLFIVFVLCSLFKADFRENREMDKILDYFSIESAVGNNKEAREY